MSLIGLDGFSIGDLVTAYTDPPRVGAVTTLFHDPADPTICRARVLWFDTGTTSDADTEFIAHVNLDVVTILASLAKRL